LDYFSQIKQWGEEAKKGLVCGIFGCNSPVERRCKICKYSYCSEHMMSHFHSITKTKVSFNVRTKK